jgi:hypothetical protein
MEKPQSPMATTYWKNSSKLFPIVTAMAFASILASCATPMITLESTPPSAEVFLRPYGSTETKQIGETPLSMSVSELKHQNGVNGPMVIEFRKEGYLPYRAVITDIAATDLTLTGELTAVSGIDEQSKLNRVIDQIFEAQDLGRVGRQEDALVKLRTLERDAPQVAAIYELEGGIYYLQKKYKEAFEAYTLALKLNPGEAQSVRMRNLLKALLESDSAPAAGKAGAR